MTFTTMGQRRFFARRLLPKRDNSHESVARRYDVVAHKWDHSLRRLGYDDAYTALFRGLHSHSLLDRLADGGSVLDVGIGTGALCAALQAEVPTPLRLYGVDVSVEMLRVAQERLQQMGSAPMLTKMAEEEMDYADCTFDVVMSAHMLEHLDDPLVGLREMYRVLKPGGVMLVVMTQRSLLGRLVDLRWNVHGTDSPHLCGWMQSAGLVDVRPVTLRGSVWSRCMSVAAFGVRPLS